MEGVFAILCEPVLHVGAVQSHKYDDDGWIYGLCVEAKL